MATLLRQSYTHHQYAISFLSCPVSSGSLLCVQHVVEFAQGFPHEMLKKTPLDYTNLKKMYYVLVS